MKETYSSALAFVLEQEGGYSDDVGDPGGPTNWGVTIEDARRYWKQDATAADVKAMPKSVAESIYLDHYATPLRYNDLPPGVDLAVLDYGVNSGNHRSAITLQDIVMAPQDGVIGPITLAAVFARDPEAIIKTIYSRRLAFLQGLKTWSLFGKGWTRRCTEGQVLALALAQQYPKGTYVPPQPAPPAPAAASAAHSWLAAFVAPMLPQIVPLLIPYVTKALRDLADDLDREYGKAK